MKIAIIEDEIGITNFLKQGLKEENYHVVTADDGEKGLELIFNSKPDLILLDWMLPKISGIEVCKKVRSEGIKTPIIFLTARDTIKETVEGLKAGANDYIKKPFSFEELLARISIYFREKTDFVEWSLGPIKLNLQKHQVLVNDREVSLTQREFELLLFLIKNKGFVCSRTQIIEEVWNIHFEYDTGVIDVFINSIRKKLNLSKDQEYIKTIRGIGYIAKDNN
ncbi:response regulator transcription factor [Flavobacterium sp.]|uniref:response regulator transcription factor n=1 Tax=Flavobacterium sp. TaxID=239 RepID=UPI0026244761|nr:response regulator transcription factor [Flavobacterium sp.]MDD3005099.1 response regulator transcription factor [Flavobacterium sp.]